MTSPDLARSYLAKAQLRLEVLVFLLERGGYSDVVRKAQELVEPALKALLRLVGVEPPHHHDVGGLLLEHGGRLPAELRERLPRAAEISKSLRKERELAPGLASRPGPARRPACRPSMARRRRSSSAGSRRAGTRSR